MANVQAAWTSTDPSVATIDASGRISGVGAGDASIVATSGGVQAAASIRVLGSPATISLSVSRGVILVSGSTQITATVKDVAGHTLSSAQVSWKSAASGIATVSQSGVVTGVGPGIVSVSATIGSMEARSDIEVRRPLHIELNSSPMSVGAPVTIRGTGLSGLVVTLDGRAIVGIAEGDSVLRFQPPPELFTPCVPAGKVARLAHTSPVGESVLVDLQVAEVPIVVDLTAGKDSLFPGDIVAKGCRFNITKAGRYLFMPFSIERADGWPATAADSVTFSLSVGPAPVGAPRASIGSRADPILAANSTAVKRPRGSNALVGLPTIASPTVDYSLARGRSTSSSCPLPNEVGDSIHAFIGRTPDGRVKAYGNIPLQFPPEAWIVAASGQRATAFVDTATQRIIASDPGARLFINQFLTRLDDEVVPFTVGAVGYPMPDRDSNGRLIVYVTGYAEPGLNNSAFALVNMRTDCGSPDGASGEAILMNLTFFIENRAYSETQLANILSVGAHEIAHVLDGGTNGLSWQGGRRGWAIEGFANFVQTLWALRGSQSPLAGNIASFPFGLVPGCVLPDRIEMARIYSGTYIYAYGCFAISYMISRAVHTKGMSLQGALQRFSQTVRVTNIASMADEMLGVGRQPEDQIKYMGDWLGSWYADDFVVGTRQELQHSMWQLRPLRALWGAYPIPDIVLPAGGGAVSATLAAPDVRYIEAQLAQGWSMTFTTASPAVSINSVMGLMVLRVQ